MFCFPSRSRPGRPGTSMAKKPDWSWMWTAGTPLEVVAARMAAALAAPVMRRDQYLHVVDAQSPVAVVVAVADHVRRQGKRLLSASLVTIMWVARHRPESSHLPSFRTPSSCPHSCPSPWACGPDRLLRRCLPELADSRLLSVSAGLPLVVDSPICARPFGLAALTERA